MAVTTICPDAAYVTAESVSRLDAHSASVPGPFRDKPGRLVALTQARRPG
jgi:hypothetical protein